MQWTESQGTWSLPVAPDCCWETDPAAADRGLRLESKSPAGETGSGAAGSGLFCLQALAGREPFEVYTRRGNLLVTYPETPALPLGVMIQYRPWRSLPGVVAIECVLAIQTSLLDALPFDSVGFRLHSGQQVDLPRGAVAAGDSGGAFFSQWAASNRLCLRRVAGSCDLVAVHPSDLRWISLAETGVGCRVECRLKTARMEKGVIRLARILYAVLPFGVPMEAGVDPLSTLSRIADQFETSELPLSV